MALTHRGNNVSADTTMPINSTAFPAAPLDCPSQGARINPASDQPVDNVMDMLTIHGRVAVISGSKVTGQYLDKPNHVGLTDELRRRIDHRRHGFNRTATRRQPRRQAP